jgi:hypothetical protein
MESFFKKNISACNMGLTLTAGVVIDLATELLYTVVSGPSQHYATAVGSLERGRARVLLSR